MSDTDIKNMKVADLKRELKLRGLATTGNKTELQDRLQSALLDGELALDDSALTAGIDDDSLDEDAVLTDEDILIDTKSLNEHELLHSPDATAANVPPQLEIPDVKTIEQPNTTSSNEAAAAAPKKVMLKRTSSFAKMEEDAALSIDSANTAKENVVVASTLEVKKLKMSERNPITIGDDDDKQEKGESEKDAEDDIKANSNKILKLTQQERLELRAKKFGGNTVPEPMRPFPSGNDLQKMKERAARFGEITSSKMSKIEAYEKLQQRRQRFSGVKETGADATTIKLTPTEVVTADVASTETTTTTDATAAASPAEDALSWEDRKRLRLERFNAKAT